MNPRLPYKLAEGYAYEHLHTCTHTTLMRVLPQFIFYMLNRDQQLAAYKRIASTYLCIIAISSYSY